MNNAADSNDNNNQDQGGSVPEDSYIKLRVLTMDEPGTNEVHFRVKPRTLLGKLKYKYCERLDVKVRSLRFMYEGVRINDYDRAEKLNMEDNDIIRVYWERGNG